MKYEEIVDSINKRKFAPIYFLYGDEPYFIDTLVDEMEENILTESEKAFNQVILYGKDIDAKYVLDECRQFPMMAEYKVVIIKEAQDVKNLNDIESYLERPSSQTVLIICYKHKKLDKRTKFYKILEKRAVLFEGKKLYDNQIEGWLKQYVEKKKFKITPEAANMMAEYLGTDLSKVVNEIEKLLIGLPQSTPISLDMVHEQIGISKEFNVFELEKAFGNRDFSKASIIIDYFANNPKSNPVIPIISALYGYFFKLYITIQYNSEQDNVLMRYLGLGNAYFVKDYRGAARKYSIPKIKKILRQLKIADQKSKGINSKDDDATILKDILFEVFYEKQRTLFLA